MDMGRRIVFACFGFLLGAVFFVNAQQQKQQGKSAAPVGIGSVKGKVVEASSKKPVAFASVTLNKFSDSSLVSGALTNEAGDFTIDQVPAGTYLLKINFIGFKTYFSEKFTIDQNNLEIKLGKINLSSDSRNLNEVNVTAEKSTFQLEMDKKVYNVDKNLTQTGNNAADVLNQVPSISVDMEGIVNLRGNPNVTIFIDGKPSALMAVNPASALEQIPANSIERIEVITNPSAKFDAEGMSGIINIILKKNSRQGFNGNVTAGIGTGEKYNGGVSLNYQKEKLNLFGSYFYRNQKRTSYGNTSRYTFFPDTSFSLEQTNEEESHSINNTYRFGGEYSFDRKNSLGFTVTANESDREETEQVKNSEYNDLDILTDITNRTTQGEYSEKGMDATVNYKKYYNDPQQLFTTDFSYSLNDNDNLRNITDQDYIDLNTPSSEQPGRQKTVDQNRADVMYIQSDYVKPLFAGKGKIETGIKLTNRDIRSNFSSETVDTISDEWNYDSLLENNFNYEDNIFAAYAIYSTDLKFVKVKAGLRSEYTSFTIDQKTINEVYDTTYINLFPSIFISKTIAKETDLQVSYSRRINRPGLQALNPILVYSDPLNARSGNPYLLPEYINSFEFSAVRYRDKIVMTGTIYYRYIDNQIQRFRTVDSTGFSLMTQVNLNSGQSYGAEVSLKLQNSAWWDATLSGNIFNTNLNGENLDGNLSRSTFGGSAKLISNFKLKNDLSFQLTGDYNSGHASLLGRMKPNLSFDIGVRKDFFRKQLSTTLALTDVFDSRRFSMELDGPNYHQDFLRKRETRVLTFNVTWKFGKTDNQNTRKNQREGQQQMERMEEF